jgi:hypothetical protein
MNERDAYQLTRAFAEVFASRRRGIEYVCVSFEAVRALSAEPKYPDAYVGEEAGAIPTLGAGETRQNSQINAQNGRVRSLISYPASPIRGGRLDRAPKKIGLHWQPA